MFCQSWGIKHSVSAPYHQQANGKAESAVKITKTLLRKAHESKQDFWELLLQWRNTPNKTGSSPAQRLFSRRTRFGIPMCEEKYSPKIEEKVKEKITLNRRRAKAYYDRQSRSLPELEIGQPVFVKLKPTDKEWKKGTVINPVSDRSSVVAVEDREYRRDNTLIKAKRAFEEPPFPVKQEEGTAHIAVSTSNSSTPGSASSMEETARPRRAVQVPKRFQDFEMY
ncbi:uncharacterized protein LOC134286278 [Aedes albopictus]|uniref:Integrase catalytic domain-containing protein n=1 Tax=Aedes albopictus TaxID=7160 RepID=A0ABM1XLZ9_AEDAL